MIGVTVTFDYSGDFDREREIKVAAGARGMFEGMPGLRLKVLPWIRSVSGQRAFTSGILSRPRRASSPRSCGTE